MGCSMKTFRISYRTLEGDLNQVTIDAGNSEDAKVQLRKEYWDVYEIIDIK